MGRALFLWLSLVVGFCAMAGAGYAARSWWDASRPVPGWCCLKAGAACAERPSLESCRGDGGISFSLRSDVCRTVCEASSR
jgi:hypothetical protein